MLKMLISGSVSLISPEHVGSHGWQKHSPLLRLLEAREKHSLKILRADKYKDTKF